MSIPRRDLIATASVAIAMLIYGLWLIGPLDGLTVGSVALLVLALGFVASASAVVPGFAALLAGSKVYLAAASIVGLVALACGVLTVLDATELTLAILVLATIGLWAGATFRHATAHRPSGVATG